MDKRKYIKWYKIAKEVINDDSLVPERTDEEILDCVSEEDWLMFLPEGITREQAKSREDPNVYFYMRNDDNIIGLTFNNVVAVDKIKNLLSPYSLTHKEAIVNKLLSLDDSWWTKLNHKIKEHNFASTPYYIEELKIKSNTINDAEINKFFDFANKIRKEGKEKAIAKKASENLWYREVPGIDLMETEVNLTEEEFKKKIVEVFDVLRICIGVKSDSEIRKIQREEQRLINIKKCPSCQTLYRFDSNRTICGKMICAGVQLEKTKMSNKELKQLMLENKVKD